MYRDDFKKMVEENKDLVMLETTRWDVINHNRHSKIHLKPLEHDLTLTDFMLK